MSRVSASVWQIAHATPCLPESVLRNSAGTVAKARPVPLSEVGRKPGFKRPCCRPVNASYEIKRGGTLST